MKSEPGTYALILRSVKCAKIEIGKWGRLSIKPGYYVYIGSAFGPGGVKARVGRHFRKEKKQRWHIDYLRQTIDVVGAWCSYSPARQEHDWARAFYQQALSDTNGTSWVAGFGCSDCSCSSHLFVMPTKPDAGKIIALTDNYPLNFYPRHAA